jgi:hypothetical protein
MHTSTLFAHLAHRFVPEKENLATEALCYLLGRSYAARQALARALSHGGAAVPENLSFRTQAARDDGAIPDLVGEDGHGRHVLVVEAKFWAGLTAAQPVTYIRRLQTEGGGILAVVAPAARLELLWDEMRRRCEQAEIAVSPAAAPGPEIRAAAITPGGHLVMISWRALLESVRAALEAAGEAALASDAAQLQGLCERMDEEAFLPLQSEELTGVLGRRIIQLNRLVDDLFNLLAREGIVDGRRLRSAAGSGWYGRYFRMHGVPCLLHVNAWNWGTKAFTPLWLRALGRDWHPSPEVGRALQSLERGAGTPVIAAPEGHEVPLLLPTGVERDVVVSDLLGQIQAVAHALATLGWAAGPEVETPADAESREGPVVPEAELAAVPPAVG